MNLALGWRSSARRLVFGLLLLVGSFPISALDLEVLCRESPAESATVYFVGPLTEPTSAMASKTVPLNEPHHVEFESELLGQWNIRAEANGCWGPSVVWSGESETVTVELEAAGTLDFGIKANPPPHDLIVSFMYSRGDTDDSERFEQPCEVANGRGHCVVPAGRLDVRLVARNYAPVFLWDLEIDPGEIFRLGDIELKQGASITGWVEAVGSSDPSAKVLISARRAAEPRSTQELQRRLLAQQTVSTDEKGHFVVPGLEPGPYNLWASKEGFASRVVESSIDEPSQSVALSETLTLVPQSQLTIELDPVLDPWGQPWQLQVTRETEEINVFETVAKGAAADHGTWVSPKMSPGHHMISVIDSQGGTWRSESVVLSGGPESLYWNIEVIPVRGRVTSNGDPLKTQLLLGSGTSAITFQTEEDGTFEGHLPEEGVWPARLQTKTARLSVDSVRVRRRPGKSYAEIELDLPNTVLEGKVTKNGMPAESLVVAVRREPNLLEDQLSDVKRASELTVWSDESGSFEVLGLSPGLIEIHASDRTAESDWSNIVINENQPVRVELELAERITIRGRVELLGSPVVGAKIIVLPDGNVPRSAATGASGEFDFKLPSHVRSASLIVAQGDGGGIAFAPLRVLAEDNPEVVISLPPGRGQLYMGIDPNPKPTHSVRSLADLVPEGMLFYHGVGVSVRQLLGYFPPAGSHFDGGIPLPSVAEGRWRFCLSSSRPTPESCQQFHVCGGSSHLIASGPGGEPGR